MSPAILLKLFQDWANSEMERKLKRKALEAAKAKKKGTGAAGSELYCQTPSWICS